MVPAQASGRVSRIRPSMSRDRKSCHLHMESYMKTLKSNVPNLLKVAALALLLLNAPVACSGDESGSNANADASSPDSDSGDMASQDAAVSEDASGNRDSGNRDSGSLDSGSMDASNMDSGSMDSGSMDMGEVLTPAAAVNLGTAGNYVILAKSGISNVPMSAITGDIGVSPAAATYITGFSLTADATDEFATSPQVTGKVFASTYTSPTPSDLTTAIGAVETAFTDAAGRAPDYTELGAGDIGGMTLQPGVYGWGTGLLIPTDVTLEGSDTDVWIFQVSQNLTLSNGTRVTLSGGARAKNIFWQVAGQVSIGTTAHLEGVVLSKTAIVLGTGATVNGRLFAQTAVELDGNTVVQPAQ